jgi:hypothetical protein
MALSARYAALVIRDVIRAQPITAAVVVLALGYLLGRLGSLIPSSNSTGARR